jgi:SAM-dependent methyltransferase
MHLDREMNVWGSGGAHSAYFKQVDDIIIDLFNKPIQDQPKGILDMGCGNGAFIAHIFDVIEQRTLRGKMLEEYPLFLVGADYNEAALKVTRANLIQADVWAKVIWGDIGRPDLLARDLQENYGIALDELLNVRTFLDHNRIWSEPAALIPDGESSSTGAYAFQGRRIEAMALEENLREHLERWAPFVGRFGLLVIELHTIDPALAAAHPGQTAVTAYDGTHGFSDQYIVEIDVLHKVAASAGLHLDRDHFHRYPDNALATVSINLFKSR